MFPVFKKTALIPILQIVMVGIIILLVFLAETLRFLKVRIFTSLQRSLSVDIGVKKAPL